METENINAEEFTLTKSKAKKRTLSNGDQMQVDEASGIEGVINSHKPKAKRKKVSSEIRKIGVPPHRYVRS